ncbi:ABC transporter substrate-binding protein [Anabaena azotica]|uniref:Amino acid ABC transporter substrate-binding protein n=1 Tax=Anabaena azotica FACHB-119 TaxID=947527 RepID=A0ABR8CVX3_9NOST|nr:ABC transporter substrate-binding protein [Anabaena azotica]MBD2499074.1 amino acid ABC transporter substrate-binding protein [Anabaena azotica FACHB-119]
MSQKNETTVLVISLLLTVGIVGGIAWWFFGQAGRIKDDIFPPPSAPANQQEIKARLSFGEKTLIPGEITPEKKAGIQALAQGNYQQAIANLEASLKRNRNDPEALIYLNNARIASSKSYTIFVSVPASTTPSIALEILRGVAQAQNEVNLGSKIQGVALKVGIADDENQPETAKQIATSLVNNSEVLGVVGHYASDATLAAGDVYNSGQLVAISPTSTSVRISKLSPYVFRTVPSDFVAARTLANYMTNNLKKQNVAVFFNSQSQYSLSLKNEFISSVGLEGGQVSNEFDLANPDFSAARSLNQAMQQGAEVIMLAADAQTLDKALQVVPVNQKKSILLGGDSLYNFKTLEVGREQAVGMVVTVPWHITSDRNASFPQKSGQLWGADVNWRTAMAYDATEALIAALKLNPTRAGVQQALSSPGFSTPGAAGVVRFSSSGDRNAPVQLVRIVTGGRSGTGFDFEQISSSVLK